MARANMLEERDVSSFSKYIRISQRGKTLSEDTSTLYYSCSGTKFAKRGFTAPFRRVERPYKKFRRRNTHQHCEILRSRYVQPYDSHPFSCKSPKAPIRTMHYLHTFFSTDFQLQREIKIDGFIDREYYFQLFEAVVYKKLSFNNVIFYDTHNIYK